MLRDYKVLGTANAVPLVQSAVANRKDPNEICALAGSQIELGILLLLDENSSDDVPELAIAHLSHGIELLSPSGPGERWSMGHHGLGMAYRARSSGSRGENLEKAIHHYSRALEFRSPEVDALDWSKTHGNLGNVYCDRIEGNFVDNQETALQHYRHAADADIREADPIQWASVNYRCAHMFQSRVEGLLADNLDRAVDHYEWALTVFTSADYPDKFGNIQAQLIAIDTERLDSNVYKNATNAIAGALRMSAHILGERPEQLPGQLQGRLASDENVSIRRLLHTAGVVNAFPWLRPMAQSLTDPYGPLVRTIVGHRAQIDTVAITPDGRKAVSGAKDNTLRVWALDSGRSLLALEGHTNDVRSVAITPDGERAVSASSDHTLRIWDLASGRMLLTLEGHTDVVSSVAIFSDGRRAVSTSWDETARVWDLTSGKLIRELKLDSEIKTVTIGGDDGKPILGCDDGTLYFWDIEGAFGDRVLLGHSDPVYSVAVTPDGRHAVSGSYDGTLQVWDVQKFLYIRTLCSLDYPIHSVAITVDGSCVIAASDKSLHVMDFLTGRKLNTFDAHSDTVFGVATTPDGQRAISASWDRMLRVWDLKNDRAGLASSQRIGSSAFIPGTGHAISTSHEFSESEKLRVWDIATGRTVRILAGHNSQVTAVATTPNGRYAVSLGIGRTSRVWDLSNGLTVKVVDSANSLGDSLAITPDGLCALSGTGDRELRLWDLNSGLTLRTFLGHTGFVDTVAITPDGQHAVSSSYHNIARGFVAEPTQLRVWDLASGSNIQLLQGHTDIVNCIAFTPDSRYAISGSNDRTLRLWDLHSGQLVYSLHGHTDDVRSVAISTDSRFVVSTSQDSTLCAWNLIDGKKLAVFSAEAPLTTVSVSIFEHSIAAIDENGRVHFLQIITGKNPL